MIEQCVSTIIFNYRPPFILQRPLQVLLIQREKDPFKGKWAFPGGRQEIGESYIEACVRETREEVGLDIELLSPSRPDYLREVMQPGEYHFIIPFFAAVTTNNKIDQNKEEIVYKWFNCSPDTSIMQKQLKDEDCAPFCLKILNIAIKNHY